MDYGYIYLVTNLQNNLRYVGQKKGKLNSKYFGSGMLVRNAVLKHGSSNFNITLLDRAFSKEELDNLEKIRIKEFGCRWPKGYNLAEGGQGGDTGKRSEESKERYRQSHLGKHHTEETREKIRQSLLGRPGRVWSEDEKEKLRRIKCSKEAIERIKQVRAGTRWIYNKELKQEKLVKEELVSQYVASGWSLGCISARRRPKNERKE